MINQYVSIPWIEHNLYLYDNVLCSNLSLYRYNYTVNIHKIVHFGGLPPEDGASNHTVAEIPLQIQYTVPIETYKLTCFKQAVLCRYKFIITLE